jgi:hypothetical protein
MKFYYYSFYVVLIFLSIMLPISAQTTTPVPECRYCTYFLSRETDPVNWYGMNIGVGSVACIFFFFMGVVFHGPVIGAYESWRKRSEHTHEDEHSQRPLLFSPDKKMIFADIER